MQGAAFDFAWCTDGLPLAASFADNPPFFASPDPAMQQQPLKIQYEVYQEDGLFIARCLNFDVTSDGATDAEAVDNLREAIELYFERNAEAAIATQAGDEAEAE